MSRLRRHLRTPHAKECRKVKSASAISLNYFALCLSYFFVHHPFEKKIQSKSILNWNFVLNTNIVIISRYLEYFSSYWQFSKNITLRQSRHKISFLSQRQWCVILNVKRRQSIEVSWHKRLKPSKMAIQFTEPRKHLASPTPTWTYKFYKSFQT